MTHEDAQGISARLDRQDQKLDRQDQKLDRIVEAMTRQEAICGQARGRLDRVCQTVDGNGKDGLVREIERLKTAREIGSKGFWALVSVVSAIVSGAVLAAGRALRSWLW